MQNYISLPTTYFSNPHGENFCKPIFFKKPIYSASLLCPQLIIAAKQSQLRVPASPLCSSLVPQHKLNKFCQNFPVVSSRFWGPLCLWQNDLRLSNILINDSNLDYWGGWNLCLIALIWCRVTAPLVPPPPNWGSFWMRNTTLASRKGYIIIFWEYQHSCCTQKSSLFTLHCILGSCFCLCSVKIWKFYLFIK